MAKSINEDKINRIKEAAIELIVEKGYGGASISAIATKADVATGYLYRFYPGKYELVTDLLNTQLKEIAEEIEAMLEKETTAELVSQRLIEYFFQQAKERPFHIRFIYILAAEYRFKMGELEREKIIALCRRLLKSAHASGEINRKYKEEEVFLMLVMYPIEYINLRFKKFISNKSLSNHDKKRIHRLCINALK